MVDLVRLVVAIFLFGAAFGFVEDFILLRWSVFLGVGYLFYILLTREIVNIKFKTIFACLFAFIIFIFNPIFPIYLYNMGTWRMIDFLSALTLTLKPIIINTMNGTFSENERFRNGMMNEYEQRVYLNRILEYDNSRYDNNTQFEDVNEIWTEFDIGEFTDSMDFDTNSKD